MVVDPYPRASGANVGTSRARRGTAERLCGSGRKPARRGPNAEQPRPAEEPGMVSPPQTPALPGSRVGIAVCFAIVLLLAGCEPNEDLKAQNNYPHPVVIVEYYRGAPTGEAVNVR